MSAAGGELATFAYRAVDARGRRERGVASAPSAGALARQLRERGLVVVDVEPAAAATPRAGGWRSGARGDVLEVTRALAAILAAGVPLSRALATVVAITPGAAAEALDDVRAAIGGGESLAAALARHPRLFSPIYRGVVRAGERAGDLASAFAALSAQLEREERLRARLLSATIYPLLLLAAGGAAVTVLVLYVLPRFAELLADTGAALPASTAMILAASDALRRGWPLLLVGAVAMATVVAGAARTEGGQRALAALLLRLPVVGGFRRHVVSARFARVLGALLAGGAPLLGALDDAQESMADPLVRDDVGRIRAAVRDGVALHAAIAASPLWVVLLPRLVAIGEEAGRLEEFLARAAEICEEKADRLLQRLVALVEPAMIIVFGALVAFVALSLLQAIYGVDAATFR